MHQASNPGRAWLCRVSGVIAAFILFPALPVGAAPAQDLTQISLEDLMNIKVTSVSRKEQRLSQAAAAAFVITQEEIRRSGMTNIPDLLRMAPGVNVARITSNTWAISIRGFNNRYSTNVLVLIDGRTVYTQEFSGVFWDQQSVPVEEIERIEVIRGPGGTVWGANAVNGVINIITRRAGETQGAFASLGTGSRDSARAYARFAGSLGDRLHYRVYGTYFNVENSMLAGGSPAADGWHASQAGVRTEWSPTARDALTIQADLFRAEEGQTISAVLPKQGFRKTTFNDPIVAQTTNLLGKWNHVFAGGSETSLRLFYTDAVRHDQAIDDQNTYDADLQYHIRLSENHDIVAGIGYRHATVDYHGLYAYEYTARRLSSNLFSGFFQDEIRLPRKLSLTLGAKIEHNSFTQFEYEPGAQLVWERRPEESFWVSVSRAIRQPSFFYSHSILQAASFPLEQGGLGVFRLLGSPRSRAESMIDVSGGYRRQFHQNISVDIALFHSNYRGTATVETGDPFFELSPGPPHLVIPGVWDNQARARNYGGELFATWQIARRWRLSPGYSFLQMKVTRDPASNDAAVEAIPGNSPKHQFQVRSAVDLPGRFEWDASAYFVSGLRPNLGVGGVPPISSYTRVDTRLAWRPFDALELSATGQNLIAPSRFEFPDSQQVVATAVQRAVLGKVTWRF